MTVSMMEKNVEFHPIYIRLELGKWFAIIRKQFFTIDFQVCLTSVTEVDYKVVTILFNSS